LGEIVSEDIVRAAFEAAYARAFSRLLPGIPVRIVNLRTAAVGRRPVFDMAALAPETSANVGKAFLGRRPVWFAGTWQEAGIWDRLVLPVGALVKGPAILEQGDATTVLDPGLKATVDLFGNLIVERA
jgi:N-methylhydantoinase A